MSENEKDADDEPIKLIFKLPEPPKQARRVLVQRNPTPTVNRMLEDAYHVLGEQLALFRIEAHHETFTVQKATAFGKLISSLTQIQETERKRLALMNLSALTDDELAALDGTARNLLNGKSEEIEATREDT